MKKILIIEDDFFIRDIYSRSFSQAGYTVNIASDGQEAMEKIKTEIYDIILLDIMLPKINGVEVLRSIRSPKSRTEDIPVFLITNLGQESIIKEAFKIGADGYLLKSQITPQTIVKEIEAYLENRKKEVNLP